MARHRRAWLLLASTLAGLALAEGAARSFAPPREEPLRNSCDILRETGDARGYELISGSVQRLAYPRENGVTDNVEIRVGADGWRGTVADSAPAGRLRIVCCGDSQMFGWGVADEATFPAQLALAAPATVVLNRAVPNLQIEEKLAWVEALLGRERAEIVILELYFDDVHVEDVRLGGRRRGAPVRESGGPSWLTTLREHSRAVDLVTRQLAHRRQVDTYLRNYRNGLRPDHPACLRMQAALARIREHCESRGVRLLVVVMPLLFRDGEAWASAALDERLLELVRAARIPVLDPSATLLAGSRGDLTVHDQDQHANELAHRLVARETADWMRAEGWLSR